MAENDPHVPLVYGPLALAERLFTEIQQAHLTFEEKEAAVNITKELVSLIRIGIRPRAIGNGVAPKDAPSLSHNTRDRAVAGGERLGRSPCHDS